MKEKSLTKGKWKAAKKAALCVFLAVISVVISVAAWVFTYDKFYGDYGGLAIMVPAGIILPAVISAIIGGICGTEIKKLWFLPLPMTFIITFILTPDLFPVFAAGSYLYAVISALICYFDKKISESRENETERRQVKINTNEYGNQSDEDSWPI